MQESRAATWQFKHSATLPDNGQEYALWQAFKQGDRNAFADLLDHYYPLLLNYGARLQKDCEFVKDCLHDLFVELWNGRAQ